MVNPVTYASSNAMQQYNVLTIMKEFEDELKTMSGKCMDIGCGPGDITKNMILPNIDAEAVIIGTDISKEMIQYANKKYADNERMAFEVLDMQTKYLPKKYVSEFKHIFSFHAVHWSSNIRQTFNNIYEMLQPGGTMLVYFIASHDIFYSFNQVSQNPRYAPYISDNEKLCAPFQYSAEPQRELKNMIKSIGFNILHCSHRETIYSHVDSHTFLPAIMSLVSFLDNMPQNLKTDFLKELEADYMQRKIIFKKRQNNLEQTVILDIYKVFVVYAKK